MCHVCTQLPLPSSGVIFMSLRFLQQIAGSSIGMHHSRMRRSYAFSSVLFLYPFKDRQFKHYYIASHIWLFYFTIYLIMRVILQNNQFACTLFVTSIITLNCIIVRNVLKWCTVMFNVVVCNLKFSRQINRMKYFRAVSWFYGMKSPTFWTNVKSWRLTENSSFINFFFF
jgi:hypothetical protein